MLAKRFLCFYLFLVSALCAQLGYGQTLTISDSGQTGTSGTHWSISGNTLIVSDNSSIHPNVIEKALDLGDLNIQVTGEMGTIHIQSPIHSSKSRILKLIAQSSIHVYESIEISSGEIYLSVRDNQTARDIICVDGEISVASASGQGGNILLEAKNITLSENANLLATGPTGGGNILIGGDWQGGASAEHSVFEDPKKLMQATKVSMHSKAIIDASATENGNGGTVVLWSDIKNPASVTKAHGTIYAKGGSRSGDGGMIETSGGVLETDGIIVTTDAPYGNNGKWLLDPRNITISNGSNSGISSYTATNDNAVVNISSLTSALSGGTDVEVFTGSSGISQAGNITVSNEISVGGSGNLTLRAAGDIIINANITRSFTGGLTLRSGSGNVSGSGNINLSGATTLKVAHGNTISNNISLGTGGATIELVDELDILVLIVAGGGAGGSVHVGSSGGGGGGQVIYSNLFLVNTSLTVEVGSGGVPTPTDNISSQNSSGNGGRSSVELDGTILEALGGGGGANSRVYNTTQGVGSTTGWTGGGGSVHAGTKSIGSVGLGGNTHKGGSAKESSTTASVQAAGGGGGAGGAGVNAVAYNGGDGGIGLLSSITGSDIYYGGGGGGGKRTNDGTAGDGGNGGGGNGGRYSGGADGTVNTGGGGGGSGEGDDKLGGSGGSGIVIIRYAGNTTMASGGIITTGDTFITHSFTDTGSSTFSVPQSVKQNFSAKLTGIISGSGGLIKSGTGTLIIEGNNTYSGSTNINGGTLKIAHANGLGNSSGLTTVSDGATLQMFGGITVSEPITLNGNGNASLGALNFLSGNNTYSGAITLGSNTSITSAAGNQIISGSVNGAYDLSVTSAGTWTQSGEVGGTTPLTNYSLNAGVNNITLSGNHQVAGPISVSGGDITLSGNITSTFSGAGVLLKASEDISLAERRMSLLPLLESRELSMTISPPETEIGPATWWSPDRVTLFTPAFKE